MPNGLATQEAIMIQAADLVDAAGTLIPSYVLDVKLSPTERASGFIVQLAELFNFTGADTCTLSIGTTANPTYYRTAPASLKTTLGVKGTDLATSLFNDPVGDGIIRITINSVIAVPTTVPTTGIVRVLINRCADVLPVYSFPVATIA